MMLTVESTVSKLAPAYLIVNHARDISYRASPKGQVAL